MHKEIRGINKYNNLSDKLVMRRNVFHKYLLILAVYTSSVFATPIREWLNNTVVLSASNGQRFIVHESIGKGGFGEVMLVQLGDSQKYEALKIFMSSDADFKREAKVFSKLAPVASDYILKPGIPVYVSPGSTYNPQNRRLAVPSQLAARYPAGQLPCGMDRQSRGHAAAREARGHRAQPPDVPRRGAQPAIAPVAEQLGPGRGVA